MSNLLVSAPSGPVLTTQEAKDHLRVEISTDDTYIDTLVAAAQGLVEQILHKKLISQTWESYEDQFPECREWALPFAPVSAVSFVKYLDSNGNTTTISSSDYSVDLFSAPARIVLNNNIGAWATPKYATPNAVWTRFVVGYANAAAVPAEIKHAIKLIIGHLYENREEIITALVPAQMPKAADYLLAPHRLYDFK